MTHQNVPHKDIRCVRVHIILLHTEANSSSVKNDITTVTCVVRDSDHICHILLSTALVLIKGSNNQWCRCMALLDSGAQTNFITKQLIDKLKLPCRKTEMPISGVGGIGTNITNRTSAAITSLDKSFAVKLSFLEFNSITSKILQFFFQ